MCFDVMMNLGGLNILMRKLDPREGRSLVAWVNYLSDDDRIRVATHNEAYSTCSDSILIFIEKEVSR